MNSVIIVKMTNFSNIKALLIDLEGVLYNDNKLIPGSIEAVKKFKKSGLKLRFLTNTTTTPRKIIFNKLIDFGFDINEEEIFTPIIATRNYLRDNAVKKISLFTNIEIVEEFNDFVQKEKNPPTYRNTSRRTTPEYTPTRDGLDLDGCWGWIILVIFFIIIANC